MICEEFRDRWEDRDRSTSVSLEHRSTCTSCATWADRENAFDGMLLAAAVVAPPPELAARLALIPARVFETGSIEAFATVSPAPMPYSLALEAAFIACIGVAAFAFGGFDPLGIVDGALAWLGDMLQAIPLVIDSPLLAYLQGIAFTAVEALATLVLIGLSIVRFSPDSFGNRSTSEPSV